MNELTGTKLIYAENGLFLNLDNISNELEWLILNLSSFSMNLLLLVIFSNIDFLGGLIEGFKRNSKQRSVKFITEFMSQANNHFENEKFANYLYENVRCILMHEASAKKFVSTHNNAERHHLDVIQLDEFDTLFIHPAIFKDEFLKAMKIFKQKLQNDSTLRTTALNNFHNLFDKDHRLTEDKLKELGLEKFDTNEMSVTELTKFIQTKKFEQ